MQVVQSALRGGDGGDVTSRLGTADHAGSAPTSADDSSTAFSTRYSAAGGEYENLTGTLAPRAALPPGAIVVAFSTLLDTEFALALIDLRRRGHTVVAVDVLEGGTISDDHNELVARVWAMQRSFMYRDMGTIGVDVVSWRGDATLDQAMHLVPDHRRRVARRAAMT